MTFKTLGQLDEPSVGSSANVMSDAEREAAIRQLEEAIQKAEAEQMSNTTSSTSNSTPSDTPSQTSFDYDFGNTSSASSAFSQEFPSTAQFNSNPASAVMNTPVTDINTPGVGVQRASDTTKDYTSVEKVYTEPFEGYTETDSPFSAYHCDDSGNIKPGNLLLMRQNLSKDLLNKHIKKAFGDISLITTFREENGLLYFNNMLIAPKLPADIIATVPPYFQQALKKGAFYELLDFSILKKMPNLRSIKIADEPGLFDSFFWQDVRVNRGDIPHLQRFWRNLDEFTVNGADLITAFRSSVETESNMYENELQAEREARKARGRRFGTGLAALLGIGNTANEHPVLSAIGNSPLAKAIRHGGMFTGALGLVNFGLMIANPFIVLGSLFTVGAYVAHAKAKSNRENGNYNYSGYSFGQTSRKTTKQGSKSKGKSKSTALSQQVFNTAPTYKNGYNANMSKRKK